MTTNDLSHIPRKVLVLNVWLTQGILAVLSIIGSWLVFDSLEKFVQLWYFDKLELFTYGLSFSVGIILANVILSQLVPEKWFDDGGVNEKLFGQSSIPEICFISFAVALCEETFFRGVLQTQFGLILASIIFAVIHFRYLKNPFLFCFIMIVSLLFGILFEITNSLSINVTVHFLVDSVLGFILLYENKKELRNT